MEEINLHASRPHVKFSVLQGQIEKKEDNVVDTK